ncbi:hypothetical protein Pcinc_020685 [Petrolisthes cinctipes]|uniref:Uncharacterized protein n=1 Tax=Petrolisthes cinctipes TaxID=88211 RepID=A0AAE1KL40_PETCI|nr:hypothetical protein Pcinc_020685 [Petrolisthes cinctipes]
MQNLSRLETERGVNMEGVTTETEEAKSRNSVKNVFEEYKDSAATLERARGMEGVTETGPTKEDEEATFAKEMKKGLELALSRAVNSVESKHSKADSSSSADNTHCIRMTMRSAVDESNPLKVELLGIEESRDVNIASLNVKGVEPLTAEEERRVKAMMQRPSAVRDDRTKHNTLTGKVFLDVIQTKVFPFFLCEAERSTLYHPKHLRGSFSQHFHSDNSPSGWFADNTSDAKKTKHVSEFIRMIEYSLSFNKYEDADRQGSVSALSRLIYVLFEKDMGVVRHISDVLEHFRSYTTGDPVSLKKRGEIMESVASTVFTAVLPLITSMETSVAESTCGPTPDDVRLRIMYALVSLLQRFLECVSKRADTLKNVLDKSGLVNKLSRFPGSTNTDKTMTFDIQYDYSLLYMLAEMVSYSVQNLTENSIDPLNTVILTLGTLSLCNGHVREAQGAYITIDENHTILSNKQTKSKGDLHKIMITTGFINTILNRYIYGRFKDNLSDVDTQKKAMEAILNLLKSNSEIKDLIDETDKEMDKNLKVLKAHMSNVVLHRMEQIANTITLETLADGTKDPILVRGATTSGNLGTTATRVALSMARKGASLDWIEVSFRADVEDTLLWAMSGSTTVDPLYQLAVPPSPVNITTTKKRPIKRFINNASSPLTVTDLSSGSRCSSPASSVHIFTPASNVSFVMDRVNKTRYESAITSLFVNRMIPVKGKTEVPRMYTSFNGKWVDNWMNNKRYERLPVNRWKLPSASLVYGMLSNKYNIPKQEEGSGRPITEFMGGSSGNIFMKMMAVPDLNGRRKETNSSKKGGLMKSNKNGYATLDVENALMMMNSDRKIVLGEDSPTAASSAVVPYYFKAAEEAAASTAAAAWWIRGIPPNKRKYAIDKSSVQEHLYHVYTPMF